MNSNYDILDITGPNDILSSFYNFLYNKWIITRTTI